MSDQEYYQLIRCVKKSIQEDDLESAQKIAQFLVDYYPDQFEGLLLMAGLSSPGESQVYLQKAKALNPNHPTVKKALSWAASHQGQGDKGQHQGLPQKLPDQLLSPRPDNLSNADFQSPMHMASNREVDKVDADDE